MNSRDLLTCASCQQQYQIEDSDSESCGRFCSAECEADGPTKGDADGTYVCTHCGERWRREHLDPLEDEAARLEPGDEVPEGQCPACGGMCFEPDEEATDINAPQPAGDRHAITEDEIPVLIEQLEQWANDLDVFDFQAVRGIVAGMREVAADLKRGGK